MAAKLASHARTVRSSSRLRSASAACPPRALGALRSPALAASRRRAHEHDPLIRRAAPNQPRRLEAEDGRVHRLPRDLRDAKSSEVDSSGLVPNTLRIPTPRGQPEVLQFAVQQRPEPLVREPEQVARSASGWKRPR